MLVDHADVEDTVFITQYLTQYNLEKIKKVLDSFLSDQDAPRYTQILETPDKSSSILELREEEYVLAPDTAPLTQFESEIEEIIEEILAEGLPAVC